MEGFIGSRKLRLNYKLAGFIGKLRWIFISIHEWRELQLAENPDSITNLLASFEFQMKFALVKVDESIWYKLPVINFRSTLRDQFNSKWLVSNLHNMINNKNWKKKSKFVDMRPR